MVRDSEDITMCIEAWREKWGPTDEFLADVLDQGSYRCLPPARPVGGGCDSDRGVDAVGISNFFAEQEVGVPAEVVLLGC